MSRRTISGLVSISVRIPPDLYDYVDSLAGRTFTAKLIRLIRDDMNGCSTRQKNLDLLNDRILQRLLYLQTLLGTLRDQSCLLNDQITEMEDIMSRLTQDPDDLSEEAYENYVSSQ